jgi:hypothetical protein
MCITDDDSDLIEQYIKAIPYGQETLDYDVNIMDLAQYKECKDSELKILNKEEQELLIIGFKKFEEDTI